MEKNLNEHITSSDVFTAHRVSRMFQIEATKQTLLNAESRGDIPVAKRVERGKTSYRAWELAQLPLIGEKMGFLKRPPSCRVASVFSLKGGTSKSSLCFQIARSFALHNVRTLVIGLDAQETITQTLGRSSGTSEEDGVFGIYHALAGGIQLSETIKKTDLGTLNYIPETIELSVLDLWLKNQKRREYVLKEKIVTPLINEGRYDLILFDCNPSWSEMVTGALGASHVLISPLGADINSLKAARIFIELLADFQEDMRHVFRSMLIVPTMVETNKLSQTILAKYRLEYGELCTASSVRRAVAVQEANVRGKSLLELGGTAPVLQDLVGVLTEIGQCFSEEVAAPMTTDSRQDASVNLSL